MIDCILQIKPESRLGAGPKGSGNDYNFLRTHPFFQGVEFGPKLITTKVPVLRKISDSDSKENGDWDIIERENEIVHQGDLKKKNKYFWNQSRTFILMRDGKLNYYKDKVLLRGFIQLCANTKVVKTGRDKFEIVTPGRTFYLSEDEGNRLSSETWIDKIREVILYLKNKK